MRALRSRRPSPALIVAFLALAVALGGTAYAVNRINGATIKPRSIPGNRLARNALTGTEINEGKLGRVPESRNATNSKFALRASAADSATNALNAASARRADSAGSADSASTAANAGALGGLPAGAFQPRVRWALVSGGVVVAQSGGVGAVTSLGADAYAIDFGEDVTGKGLLVTPSGTTASAVAATPCGCTSALNDGRHARVQLPSGISAFYVAALG